MQLRYLVASECPLVHGLGVAEPALSLIDKAEIVSRRKRAI